MVALPCALWICFEGVVNFPGEVGEGMDGELVEGGELV